MRKMADEFKAGVRHFDVHIGGSSSAVSGLLDEAILDPVENWLVLAEVKDPKQWWGGHLWVDRSKKFIYSSLAYLSETIWYNTDLVKPAEIRSYDDLLNPKWKGKIGFLDPRTPGAGDSNWSFMWETKGEEYLKKLATHDLVLGRDQRLLAENLAKGKVAMMIGLTYYSYLPFVKASLPIKPLPALKEGTFATGGSGNLAIIRNPAPSERYQSFRELGFGPRRTGSYESGAGTGNTPARCRYQMAARDRRYRRQGPDLSQRISSD